VYPNRLTKEGRPFQITTPDYTVSMIEFASGPVARLSANFYNLNSKQGGSLEFHGDEGSLWLKDFQQFNAAVEFGQRGKPMEEVPFVRPPFEGIEFGRGVEELAEAIGAGRPQRASGAHAAHVIEIIEAIQTSARERHRPIELTSSFAPPEPMPWSL
jgi:predicted dehydrogenase